MKLKTQFHFDAAHRLVGYKGKCQQLHGHRWNVELEVEGTKLDDVGILWDFTNVRMLEELYDHKTLLKNCPENYKIAETIIETCGVNAIYPMSENPTAEHIAYDIVDKIKQDGLEFKVRVYETPTAYAEVNSEEVKK